MTNQRPRLLALLAAAAVLGLSGRSRADDLVPTVVATPPEPHTGVGLNVGIGSAVGFAGVTLTEAFARVLRVELGAGLGLTGYQLSFMPKIALGQPHDHFVAGVGISVAFPDNPDLAGGHPIWLNVDAVGYEHRFDSGIAISTAAGLSGGLGGGTLCFPPDGCEAQFQEPVTHWWFPQARVGLAYWF
jgi:hypothetical protein